MYIHHIACYNVFLRPAEWFMSAGNYLGQETEMCFALPNAFVNMGLKKEAPKRHFVSYENNYNLT